MLDAKGGLTMEGFWAIPQYVQKLGIFREFTFWMLA